MRLGRHRESRPDSGLPVVGNGDISSPQVAARILKDSPLAGLMIGRGAVRNPGFSQIRQLAGQPASTADRPQGHGIPFPTPRSNRSGPLGRGERLHVERIKKFLNFIGEGIGADFLYAARRASAWSEMESIWARFLDHNRPMPLIPPSDPS